MLSKIDIDNKIRELVKERAAKNQGMQDVDFLFDAFAHVLDRIAA